MISLSRSILPCSLALNNIHIACWSNVLPTSLSSWGFELILERVVLISNVFVSYVQLLHSLFTTEVFLHLLISRAFLGYRWRFLKQKAACLLWRSLNVCLDWILCNRLLLEWVLHVFSDKRVCFLQTVMVFIEHFAWIDSHLKFAQSFKSTPKCRVEHNGFRVVVHCFFSFGLSLTDLPKQI